MAQQVRRSATVFFTSGRRRHCRFRLLRGSSRCRLPGALHHRRTIFFTAAAVQTFPRLVQGSPCRIGQSQREKTTTTLFD
ncbi:hypothetical protein DAI22_04g018000 [Oryza sativa Japonica Group]|nr:hypothetical protein DAI22_04g018000 [Oryza sativa Japonica Group]